MELTPEERRKIYEEEKARIEAREQLEREKHGVSDETSTGLAPNVAGLLCYLGIWITGIVFFVLEQKNKWVRFHAAQSIIVFGVLFVTGMVLGWIPFIGHGLASIVGIVGFILWIVLMVKAYNGELFKVVAAGDIAERMVFPPGTTVDYSGGPVSAATGEAQQQAAPGEPPREVVPELLETEATPAVESAGLKETKEKKAHTAYVRGHGARITGSAFIIAFSIILLIFFNFFHQYVAYYNVDTTGNFTTWTKYPFFTGEIDRWLPVVNTALGVSILGHLILIIFDNYYLRRGVLFVIDVLGLTAVVTLLTIFPFDFSVIPNDAAGVATEVGVRVVLVCIAVGIGISLIVRLIKTLVDIGRGTAR